MLVCKEKNGMMDPDKTPERSSGGFGRRLWRRPASGAGHQERRSSSRILWIAAVPVALGAALFALHTVLGVVPASSDDGLLPAVTYSRDVAPILQDNCQECHRPGHIAPFPLTSYEEAKEHAPLIEQVTNLRLMPPWKAAKGYGRFRNERMLTEEQIETIGRWVEEGAPEGNPSDLPTPKTFTDDWQLGKPDIVLDAGEDFRVKKSKKDLFWSFVLPYTPEEDVWISAIDVLPGVPEIVHHIGIYVDQTGEAVKLDKNHPGPGYPGIMSFSSFVILDFWTPGGVPVVQDRGCALKIPAGSSLVLGVHYARDGREHYDRTRIGLYLAGEEVDKRVRFGVVGNTLFEIPAGETRHQVTASRKIPQGIHLVSGMPHMHYLGKEMKVWAALPDGTQRPVVWVPDYDFHWQQVYMLEQPLALPEGTSLNLVAYYDNSTDNPENPRRRPRTVYFGQKAKNEMCFFYFHYTVDAEHLTRGIEVESEPLELQAGGGG
jgi:mono/diheme cytochrome c family protein